jgi:hypothetical protein
VAVLVPEQLTQDGLFKMAQGPALSYGIKVYLLLQLILVLMHIPLQQESQPQIVDPTHGERDFHL